MLLCDIASLVRLSITVSDELPPARSRKTRIHRARTESLYEADYNIAPDDTSIVTSPREPHIIIIGGSTGGLRRRIM
jgi:hypothetical protein